MAVKRFRYLLLSVLRSKLGTLVLALVLALGGVAHAGTTGTVRGRVVDADTHSGIAGASVSIVSPSQSATTKTDVHGDFVFISLQPDTYTVTVSAQGYELSSLPGLTVQADQLQNIALEARKSVTSLGTVRVKPRADSLVRPGTTSDVYSVNAATQRAVAAIAGTGGLNTAYSAISTSPGAYLPASQMGWNQMVYVRGGDVGDVSYELDGVPLTRASDLGTATGMSTLGQQEVQVYTGGTPATDSSALAGFINQVVKTGTFPGYANATIGLGFPTAYHDVSFEIGGATPDHLFSYYVGSEGLNQSYRYVDQFNGVSYPLVAYPIVIPSNNGLAYDGSGPTTFVAGGANAVAATQNRETIGNFHLGVPHKHDGGRDDIQLLYVTGEIWSQGYDTQTDLGLIAYGIPQTYFGTSQLPYFDSVSYTGQLFAPPDPAQLSGYYQPSSPGQRPPLAPIPLQQYDGTDNGFSITKLQYQRNINDRSYLRFLGYSQYTNWFVNGPVSADLIYGAYNQDYETHSNVWGGALTYSDQLSSHNLITAGLSGETQKILTANRDNFSGMVFNYVGNNGQCFDPATGLYASCFASNGVIQVSTPNTIAGAQAQFPVAAPPPPGSPAAAAGARWLVTDSGLSGTDDRVVPTSYAASIGDHWHANDRLNVDAGLRVEQYQFSLPNTVSGYPARAFWFDAWNRENCFIPGQAFITPLGIDPASGASIGPLGTPTSCASLGGVPLVNQSPASVSYTVWEPRVGATYTINADTVLRASAGRYAQAPLSTYQQFNTYQQNLASFLGQFLPYGYNSPYHKETPEYSNSYDLSLEKHIRGTDESYKITPFYRSTQDQIQLTPIGPQGVFSAINSDVEHNSGVEFTFRKGDFGREGLSYQVGYTYTNSVIRYNDLGNGLNAIDTQNSYIQLYNSYTSACASATPTTSVIAAQSAPCGIYGNLFSQPTFPALGGGPAIVNPYYNQKLQPLLARNGWYTPYTVVPFPLQGANGYALPNNLNVVVNYKTHGLTLTPSATFTAGSKYGSPLQWMGYDPSACGATLPVAPGATSGPANTQTCTLNNGLVFIPDAYTGQFDAQGAFVQPSQLVVNMQIAYQVTPRVGFTATMMNLIDHCYQRGYPWDSSVSCSYAQLASNHLPGAGNWVPLASAPLQLRYPYGTYGSGINNGYVATKMPFNAVVSMEVKL